MNESLITVWSEEYQRKGIPSSFRKDPTQALVEFMAWYQRRNLKPGYAADIGCGQGRNSFYLVKEGFTVTALDLLQENADLINEEAKKRHLPLSAYGQNAAAKWPISSDSLDIAVDIFCYKHIVDKKAQKLYRAELAQALKPGGYYFVSLASIHDGFYGPLLTTSPDFASKLIIDPHSQIPSFLYSLDELIEEFSDTLHLVEAEEKQSKSPMYGKEYSRSVLNCIFRKE
ncbi:MAG: class I SAM-dependent methyltransferase [Rhabdochlamydiaceae bacterium]|jgi:SAM-dependent methyltransferase